jgi:hypothetical protein
MLNPTMLKTGATSTLDDPNFTQNHTLSRNYSPIKDSSSFPWRLVNGGCNGNTSSLNQHSLNQRSTNALLSAVNEPSSSLVYEKYYKA